MKRSNLFSVLVFLLLSSNLFSADVISKDPETDISFAYAASGEWEFDSGILKQNDSEAPLAQAHFKVDQSGIVYYDFNVSAISGVIEDGHGGFGIHVFVDSPSPKRKSWGSGRSFLLWLNYDENPLSEKIPGGLSAQIYESVTNSRMYLRQSFDLNGYLEGISVDDVDSLTIPIRLQVNGNDGSVIVEDPINPETVYVFSLGKENLKGNYVTIRTNGMNASFEAQ